MLTPVHAQIGRSLSILVDDAKWITS